MYKNINQHNTEVVNTYKINKHLNLKKAYYNINDTIVIPKNETINTNDNRNVTKHNKLFNITDSHYYTKKINNTSNIANNITKHNHNNYEHNVIKKVVSKHIKHINNFYNETFNVRKVETISLSQQTDIVNNITETNNQTISYIDDNFLNTNNIATITLNTGSVFNNDKYLWIPEISDIVVPGLESLLTYLEETYATVSSVQGTIDDINDINDNLGNYMNTDQIATYVLNAGYFIDPENEEEYMWEPNTNDYYVPGLGSLLQYLELNYATITSLQNAITDMNNHIQSEIANIEFPTNPTNPDGATKTTRHYYINHEHNLFKKVNNHIHNKKNYYNFYNDTFNFKKNDKNVDSHSVSKELHYNTTHTDYMYQRKVIKNHKTSITQQQYFTYQRKGNNELQIQALNAIVAGLQTQINNLGGV